MSGSFLKKIFITTFSIFLIAGLQAQTNKTNFKGIIIDDLDLPLPGATIMILDAKDSTLVQFGSSDNEGNFLIKNVAKGEYLLNVNFLAHAPWYMSITSGLTEEVDLGKIKLVPANTVLSEVEVKADIVPIEITKDTISYNADAFETQPNAAVEELLKKLPGIEVGQDGSIKAQGEDVTKILVDGKEFFGDDPTMATKNLPAKSVKKVKVYDKQSDMAEFTGVDDGTRMKTIDLQLKEEFKKGLFGTAQAGYGTDDRYNGKASVNRFSKTSQLSFLGQLNNINDQGFSFNDRMNFSGGMSGMSGMSGGGGGQGGNNNRSGSSSAVPMNSGTSNGLVTTGAAGLNFNYQKSKNFNIRSSYFYNGVDKELLQNSYRQNLTQDPYDSDEDTDQDTKNHSHSAALNSDIQIDSSSQVQITSRLGFGDGTSDIQSYLQTITGSTTIENQSNSLEDNTSDNLTFTGGATYMKRLGSKGRNFSVNGTYTKNDNDTESGLDALTEYFTTGEVTPINQLQNTTSNNVRMEGQLSYSEPLRKRRFLEFNYYYNKYDADYDKIVKDITDTNAVINQLLTTDYNSVFQYHRPGITFRYAGEVHNLNIGLNYQISDLTGQIELGENEIKRSYNHFLPRVIWRYDIGNGKNLRFSYTTRVNQPSITQLSPVVDNSDPVRLYVGNPTLDAEYNHQLSLNFHSFSQFSSTSFFVNLNSSITQDKIINSTTVDEKFRELSRPVNIDDETRIGLYANYGRPFKPIHSRFTVNANISYTNTQNYINSNLSDVNRWTRAGGITFSNLNSKVLEYSLGGQWTTTGNYYKNNSDLDQNTLLSAYFIDVTVTLWKKWKLQGGYDFNLYADDQFAEDQSYSLMDFSISRFILSNDRGQIKFSIFDALDQNRGISRTADVNYIEEVRSNSIGRYAMLSFIYSIRGMNQPGQGQGGMFRMMEQRH